MFQKPKINDDDDDEDEEQFMIDLQLNSDAVMDQSKVEEKLVEEFLNKFVIVSESSTLDHISIILMLRALPNQIVDYNLEQMELFNFKIYQDSLIAFQNKDIVNAFEYFDEKNRDRAQNIKEMLLTQKSNLTQVHDIIGHVKNKI